MRTGRRRFRGEERPHPLLIIGKPLYQLVARVRQPILVGDRSEDDAELAQLFDGKLEVQPLQVGSARGVGGCVHHATAAQRDLGKADSGLAAVGR